MKMRYKAISKLFNNILHGYKKHTGDENMKAIAGIVLKQDLVDVGVDGLKNYEFKKADFDKGMIRNIIKQLEHVQYDIKLITWSEFLEIDPKSLSLVVITQCLLNSEKDVSERTLEDRLKKTSRLIENGVSIVLLHHSHSELEFQKLIDVDIYKGNIKEYCTGKSSVILKDNEHALVKNVEQIIQAYPKFVEDEEFTYQSGRRGKFQLLISKNRKKENEPNFILFGYQEMNPKSSVYLIDIHNVGESETQASLFDLLFHNTLQYVSKDTDPYNTICRDIDSMEIENYSYIGKEGAPKQVLVNKYERNSKLRHEAIMIHGFSCMGCKFDFNEFYGEHGRDFIEVHHIKPLSKIKEETTIDPKKDMIVLCSNCHRMVHRNPDSPLSLRELKKIIAKNNIS